MKKIIKLLISISVISILIASIFAVNVSAAGTTISTKTSIKVGETVNVTIRFNAGETISAIQALIKYDATVLEYISGASSGGAGQLNIVEYAQTDSATISFKALKSGSSIVSVSNCIYCDNQATEKNLTGASVSIAVTDATKSDNANLKSLSLSDGILSPAFSPNVTTYNVTVKNSVTTCKIYATTADSAATMTVEGSQKLQIGKNTRSVTVTAPGGAQKTYTINITRNETDDEIIDENPEGSLNVTIGDSQYILVSDLTNIELFNGFEIGEAEYNGQQISVAKSQGGEYVLYYLTSPDSTTFEPYTYNEDTKTFEKLQYFVQGSKTFIFADFPSDLTLPQRYYSTNVKIGEYDVKGFSDSASNITDFYYIYCYSGDGYEFYRYDIRDEVLQRYPELITSKADVEPVENNKGIIERYKLLSGNSKLIVLAASLLILAIFALAIILIIQLIRRSKVDTSKIDSNEDNFDEITFDTK